MDSLLSIVPYRVIPVSTGGQLSIVDLHHHMGMYCHDNMVSTSNNDDESKYSFKIHRVFPPVIKRYLPYYKYNAIKKIAKDNNVKYICCDHPYMGLTAIRLSKELGVPWFLRSHNIESERFKTLGKVWWPVMRRFESYMMHKSDGVFFITQEDGEWAAKHYKLDKAKCHTILHGTILSTAPAKDAHAKAKQLLAGELNLDADVPWLYFLGALDYKPNHDAIVYILDEILPRLDKHGIKYQLLLAGKGLSEELKNRIAQMPNGKYVGFVKDLNDFLNACNIMLNPVMTGGGIKTKAVEALGYNKIVISSAIGAAGLIPAVCGNNLHVTPDYDWDAFSQKLIDSITITPAIPQEFYNTYTWSRIAEKAVGIMKNTSKK